MAETFDPEAPRREVAIEDLTYEIDEAAFMAALPEVAKQLRIANLLKLVELLGPSKSRQREQTLAEAMALLAQDE